MSCDKYVLNLEKGPITFESKEELSRFIMDNRERLQRIKKDNGIHLSKEFQKQAEVLAKLKNISDAIKLDENKFDEKELDRKVSKKGYLSVTKAITKEDLGEKGVPFVTGFNFENYKKVVTKKLVEEGANKEEVEKHIEDLKYQWALLAKFGTSFHKYAELFFNSDDSFQARKDFMDYAKKKGLGLDIVDISNMGDLLSNVKRALLQRYGENAQFISEFKITSNNKEGENFVGVIDLLVVTENGDVHICDFKTSPKTHDEADQAKQLTYSYQLGFYRQMLAQRGIYMAPADLNIIPIRLVNVDYQKQSYEISSTFGERDIDTRNSASANTSYAKSIYEQLALANGKITKRVEGLMPNTTISFKMDTSIADKLDSAYKTLFGFDGLNSKGVNRKYTLDYIKKTIKQGTNGKYGVRNTQTNKTEYYNTREEAEKKAIEIYNANMENPISYALEFSRKYNAALKSGKKRFDFSNVAQAERYNKLFGTYLANEYTINEELLDFGIIVFQNDIYKTIDFFTITGNIIKLNNKSFKYKDNGAKITGNLVPDSTVNADVLEAVNGNVDLMKTMLVINEFLANNDGEYKVNGLKVYCAHNGQSAVQMNNVLRENFRQLLMYARKKNPDFKLTNNFENGKIEMVDPIVKVINKIDEIRKIDDKVNPELLNKVESKLKVVNNSPRDQKLQLLHELSNEVTNDLIGYGGTLIDPLHIDNMASMLYGMIYEAMAEEGGILAQIEYNDTPKYASFNSQMYTSNQQTNNRIVNEFELKVLSKYRKDLKERLNFELTPIENVCSNYLIQQGYIDSSFNAFKSLVIMQDGDTPILRVLNPDTANITQEQKDFLNYFLRKVNAIRYPITKGDKNSEEAKQYIATGEWFDIPLMEAGLFSKTANAGVKGFKKWISDKWELMKNPNSLFETNKIEKIDEEKNKFLKYVNSMKIKREDRDNFIRSKGVDWFSINLAEILAEYTYKNVIEEETNKVLPWIRTSIILQHWSALMTNSEVKEACEVSMKKYQSDIYNVNQISKGEEPIYGAFQVIDNLISTMTIPFNPKMFARELVTGRYNNYLRTVTKFGGSLSPSVQNLTKAYGFVDLYAVKALGGNQNKLFYMNKKWNIGGRAMREMLESHRANTGEVANILGRSAPSYILAQMTDYEHRMALFSAFMMEDGSFDAYVEDNDNKTLVYDFSKDKRFDFIKECAKTGKVPEGRSKDLAKYNMLLAEFNEHLPEDKKLKFGDDLPEGITEKQISTFLNISNQIHGNMDADTQMFWKRYLVGKVFTKFQTHVSAKATNLFLKPGKYQRYEEIYMDDPNTGQPLWIKVSKDPETGEFITTYTTDYNDPDCIKQRAIKLDIVGEAGTFYALKDAFKLLSSENRAEDWETLKNDEAKMRGLRFLVSDLFCFLTMGLFASLAGLKAMRKEDRFKYDIMKEMLVTPTTENNPLLLAMGVINTINAPITSISKKWATNTMDFITSENYHLKNYVYNTYGFGKFVGPFLN